MGTHHHGHEGRLHAPLGHQVPVDGLEELLVLDVLAVPDTRAQAFLWVLLQQLWQEGGEGLVTGLGDRARWLILKSNSHLLFVTLRRAGVD